LPHYKTLAAVLAVLAISAAAHGQTCTTPPAVNSIDYSSYPCYGSSSSTSANPCIVGNSVTFTSSLPLGPRACDTYTWNFGDGHSSVSASNYITHTYTAAGSYTATMTATNSVGSASASATLNTIYGYISVSYTNSYTEGMTASVPVSRSYTNGAASVHYATSDGTAKAGVNYTATSGTLQFADGESTKSFNVPLLRDNVYTGTQYFNATLSSPSTGYSLGNTTVPIQIYDADPPPRVGFPVGAYTISENGGAKPVTVTRSGDMTGTVTAGYTVYGGGVLEPLSGTLTFGPNETTKTFNVTPINDNVYTGTRNAFMYLSANYTTNSTAYVYVEDDEKPPTITVDDVSVTEGNSGDSDATLTAKMSTPVSFYTYLYWSTQNQTATAGSDYRTASGSVMFAPGETTKTFTVPIVGDTTVEANETLKVNLQISSGYGYPVLPRTFATCTILNDDIGIGPAELRIATGSTSTLSIRLAQPPTAPSSIALTSSVPEVASVPDNLDVATGDQNINIKVKGLQAGSATIRAVLPAALGGNTLTARVFVYDPVTLQISPSSLTIPLDASRALTLSLNPPVGDATVVALQPSSASVLDLPGTVTIPPNGSVTVTVKALKKQPAAITLTLPAQYGGASFLVPVDVVDVSTTPYVTQVAPANGPAGGGTAVAITGGNFTAPCSVTFGGSAASGINVASATSITAVTPAHTSGAVDVAVTCGSNPAYTFTNGFTYLSASAALTGITPAFGSTAGGTLVRLSGTNLRSGCGVFFDTAPAHNVTYESPSSLTAIVPRHGEAAVDVSLRCGGEPMTLRSAFTYTNVDDPTPSIASVDPLFAAPGQAVTLNGSRFRAGDAISFGIYPAAVLSTTPDKHVVRVPDMPVGKASINLTDPNLRLTTTGPIFNVLEPVSPQITAISPASGAAGSEIVIEGRGFRAPYSFGLSDHEATLVSLAFDRAVIRVPHDLSASSYPVAVLNAMHQIASVGPQFAVMANGPSIDSVTPGCATSEGLVAVTIHGGGFVAGATVTFDGNNATGITVADEHTIRATAPACAVGAVKVTVKNPDGTTASLSDGFRYVSAYDPDGGCAARPRPMRR
jgi:Calx-beta domain/PKD domain/IPT/TIG domain